MLSAVLPNSVPVGLVMISSGAIVSASPWLA